MVLAPHIYGTYGVIWGRESFYSTTTIEILWNFGREGETWILRDVDVNESVNERMRM